MGQNRAADTPVRVLFIGPLPPPVGGATVLFQQLIASLRDDRSLDIEVIDTAPKSATKIGRATGKAAILWNIFRSAHTADVISFHSSLSGAIFLGPLVRLTANLHGKPWMFRGFGGGYREYFSASGQIRKRLLRIGMLSADLVLLESKALVSFFKTETSAKLAWYPNSRPLKETQNDDKVEDSPFSFCFLGHVKETKGVQDLIDAASLLSPCPKIDVYGPLVDGFERKRFENSGVRYCGELPSAKVAETLAQYDAFVFPSYYEGECYPGAILEALAAGLPVITTRWRFIPELVDNTCGILVEPRNPAQLAQAMRHLEEHPAVLRRLSIAARDRAMEFEAGHWSKELSLMLQGITN